MPKPRARVVGRVRVVERASKGGGKGKGKGKGKGASAAQEDELDSSWSGSWYYHYDDWYEPQAAADVAVKSEAKPSSSTAGVERLGTAFHNLVLDKISKSLGCSSHVPHVSEHVTHVASDGHGVPMVTEPVSSAVNAVNAANAVNAVNAEQHVPRVSEHVPKKRNVETFFNPRGGAASKLADQSFRSRTS